MKEKNKISLNDKIVNFVSNNIVWVFLGFIFIVIILPRLFIGTSKIGFLDNLKPNEIGDAIGGMTAPIIGLFSAFLVYIAFREQKKANEIQLRIINEEKESNVSQKEYENIIRRINLLENQIENFSFTDGKDHSKKQTGITAIYEIAYQSVPSSYIFEENKMNTYYRYGINLYYILYSIEDILNSINSLKIENALKENLINHLKTLFRILLDPALNQLFKNTQKDLGKTNYKVLNYLFDSYTKILKIFNLPNFQ